MRTIASAAAVVAALVVLLGVGPASAESELQVRDPVASQGTAVASVYFTLVGGAQDDTLVGASTKFAKTSIHRIEHRDGLTRMRTVDEVKVPANTPVPFAPAGMHVMLEQMTRPLTVGDTFELRLEFERGGERVVSVPVVSDAEITSITREAQDLARSLPPSDSSETRRSSAVIVVVGAVLVLLVGGLTVSLLRRRR